MVQITADAGRLAAGLLAIIALDGLALVGPARLSPGRTRCVACLRGIPPGRAGRRCEECRRVLGGNPVKETR